MAKAVVVADEQNTGMQGIKAQPEKLMSFFRDVRSEMRKVVWPGREDVQTTTIVVLVTTFAFAAYFWIVDNVLGRIIEALLHKLSGK